MARINFTDKTDNTGGAYDNDPTQLTAANVNEIKNAVNGISIPDKVSQLQNDSGFINSSAIAGKADKTELSNYQLKSEMGAYAKTSAVPTKTSQLTNDSGFINSSAIAGKADKTELSNYQLKSEMGAYAKTSAVPTKTSQLTNDSNFISSYTETDPVYTADKPNLALKSEIPSIPTAVNDSVLFYNETGTLVTLTLTELKAKLDAITA